MGMSTCLPRAAKVWYEDLSGSGWAAAPGTVYEFGTLEYSTYIQESARNPGSRAVILIDVHKNLLAKTEAPGAQLGLRQFWTTYNLKSIDRLTGLITAPFTSGAFQSTLKVYKADRNLKKTEHRFELGRVNLLVAFSMGLLAAALYVRLSQSITVP
ncbi:hypothetical protein B0H10DRAFT_1960939 [Mycena sp. CBHHK59/15]|nr:hypothetical protein B0H10DRAFT_1960939 [Mycena sp. CBHHK59/15]